MHLLKWVKRIGRLAAELRFAEKESLFPVPEIRKAIAVLDVRRRKLLEDPETAALLASADPEAVPLSLGTIDALPDGKESLSMRRYGSLF